MMPSPRGRLSRPASAVAAERGHQLRWQRLPTNSARNRIFYSTMGGGFNENDCCTRSSRLSKCDARIFIFTRLRRCSRRHERKGRPCHKGLESARQGEESPEHTDGETATPQSFNVCKNRTP